MFLDKIKRLLNGDAFLYGECEPYYYYDSNPTPKKKDSTKKAPYTKPVDVSSKDKTNPAQSSSINEKAPELTDIFKGSKKVGDVTIDTEPEDWDIYKLPDVKGMPGSVAPKSNKPGSTVIDKKDFTFKKSPTKPKVIIPKVGLKFLAINLKNYSELSKEDKINYLISSLGVMNGKEKFNTIIFVIDTYSLSVHQFDDSLTTAELCKEICKIKVEEVPMKGVEFKGCDDNKLYDVINLVSKKTDEIMKNDSIKINEKLFDVKSNIEFIAFSPAEDICSEATLEDAKKSIGNLRKKVVTKFICAEESDITLAAILGFREIRNLKRTF